MNPVRPPCQDLSDLADGIGVSQISNRNKILHTCRDLYITPILADELFVSLSQTQARNNNPVRPENSKSCQAVIAQ